MEQIQKPPRKNINRKRKGNGYDFLTHQDCQVQVEDDAMIPDPVVFDEPDKDIDRRLGFAQVPGVVLRDYRLSPMSRLLYSILLSYAWGKDICWPGQAGLAANVGCDRRTVIRAVNELRTAKLISIERVGLGRCNRYHIRRITDRYKSIVDKP